MNGEGRFMLPLAVVQTTPIHFDGMITTTFATTGSAYHTSAIPFLPDWQFIQRKYKLQTKKVFFI